MVLFVSGCRKIFCSVLLNINDGATGCKTLLEKLYLLDGYFTNRYCLIVDQGRVKANDRKSMPHVKKIAKGYMLNEKVMGIRMFKMKVKHMHLVVKHFSLLYNCLFYVWMWELYIDKCYTCIYSIL